MLHLVLLAGQRCLYKIMGVSHKGRTQMHIYNLVQSKDNETCLTCPLLSGVRPYITLPEVSRW